MGVPERAADDERFIDVSPRCRVVAGYDAGGPKR
jgi:hypothetical protein